MEVFTEKKTVEHLYSEYADKIYYLAFQMTGDEELSKDILHETFIKVLEKILFGDGGKTNYLAK